MTDEDIKIEQAARFAMGRISKEIEKRRGVTFSSFTSAKYDEDSGSVKIQSKLTTPDGRWTVVDFDVYASHNNIEDMLANWCVQRLARALKTAKWSTP